MSFLRSLLVLLPFLLAAADGPSAPPAAPGGQPGSAGGGGGMGMLLMLPMIFALMYFIVIRPQRREEKKRKELMGALKRGDQVITIGGIHGEVIAVGEATVDLRINAAGAETVVRFNKGAVASQVDAAKVV